MNHNVRSFRGYLECRRSNRHVVPLYGKSDRQFTQVENLRTVDRHLRYPGKLRRQSTERGPYENRGGVAQEHVAHPRVLEGVAEQAPGGQQVGGRRRCRHSGAYTRHFFGST